MDLFQVLRKVEQPLPDGRGSEPLAHSVVIDCLQLVAGNRVERSLWLFRPTLSPDQIHPALLVELGEVDGSRTHLVLIDSEVPVPLGHHSLLTNFWYPARESNPNLNVRSVLSLSIERTGHFDTCGTGEEN